MSLFATSADLATLDSQIIDSLVAGLPGVFSNTVDDERFSAEGIVNARRLAVWEVITAIAHNPTHGFFHSLTTTIKFIPGVPVAPATEFQIANKGNSLPPFLGKPGTPEIKPFTDALQIIPGVFATANLVNDYRMNGTFYSKVAHNSKDENNRASKLAGFFNIENNIFRFTGFSCEMPLILAIDKSINGDAYNTFADEHAPVNLLGTVYRLALGHLIKDGSADAGELAGKARIGLNELKEIRAGALATNAGF